MKKIKLQFSLLLMLTGFIAHAQQTTLTSGGDATGYGGKMSYSVGQVFYNINEGYTGTVSEGIQQAYEIIEVSVPQIPGISFDISAFPNPTTDLVTLKIDNYNNETLDYILMDMKGSVLENKVLNSESTSIDMSSLQPSTYFIRINYKNQEAKLFKIIKN